LPTSAASRSPFLNPALMNAVAGSGDNSEDDFHSISSGEGNLDNSWVAADAAALRRQALMNDRSYDDEDAQLQAALAASIQDAESGDALDSIPSTANWISEEDSRAIREAQAASWTAPIVRQDSNDTRPTPDDVARIARMRAEAKQKEEDERLGITRVETKEKQRANANEEEEGEDSEDDDSEPQMTAEEMRKARLARFGA
jgi:ataxin-3